MEEKNRKGKGFSLKNDVSDAGLGSSMSSGRRGDDYMKYMTQEERLDYLVEAFKMDSEEYKDLETPKEAERKKESPSITHEHSDAEEYFVRCAPGSG